MRKLSVLIILCITLTACDYLPRSLTDKDITQYVHAYENLAAISPKLEEARKQSNAISIFTCKTCLDLMTEAVRDAGYESFESFLLMDLRISYTMRYVVYLRISKLIGDTSQDLPVEEACSKEHIDSIQDPEQRNKVEQYCRQAIVLSRHIERIGQLLSNLVEKLISKGDLSMVEKHFDALSKAITDQRLVSEFNRNSSGDWD